MASPNTSTVDVARSFAVVQLDVALIIADLMLTLGMVRDIAIILKKPLQYSCSRVSGSGTAPPISLVSAILSRRAFCMWSAAAAKTQ